MNNNPFVLQTTQTPWPPGQRQPQPAQPDIAQYSRQSHFQAPSAPAYNPQRTVPQTLRPPPPEQQLYTNDHYGSQWHRQHHQHRQDQYHSPPPGVQPLPQLVAQPNYNSYQPTAGYARDYPYVASPQPQLAYCHHPQPQRRQQQQQQRWHPTPPPPPPQDLRPANGQQFDGPNLIRQTPHLHHGPLPPQTQFQPPQNAGVYPGQSQRSSLGDGDGWINDMQPSAKKGGRSRNRGSLGGHGRGTRGSMSENSSEIADRGSYMDSGGGDRRASQSSGGVCAHWSGGNFGGAASIHAEGRNAIPISGEPAVVPVATQLQGAHNVNVSGNPRFTNIGVNTGKLTTVNYYGGTHGLENLKEFVSFAALYDSTEQDPDRRCHPRTRKKVLRQLRDWIDNPNPTDRIFWLHGPAGAGKSAIAQTIADEYKERGVAATFFFYRSDPSRNDGTRLFPTIAWQLAFSIPGIKDFIVRGLDKTPHLPTKRAETQFEELVAHPFHAMNRIATQMLHLAPVVIIDGVDECSDEKLQRRFLTVIGDAVKDTRIPLRFLIVSRPEALIEETLNKFKDFVSIDLAKLDDSFRDIQRYLEDKFSEIASNRGLDPTWPGQEIIEEIVFKSSGNFIFASVVIRFISDEDCDPEVLLNIVRNLTPRGNLSPFALLDELLLEILEQQRDQDFLKTFLALLVARSSITHDLHSDDATLMNVSQKDLHIRLRRMRSLLKFEPFIDVYHKSFFDFLQDSTRSGQYHVSKEGGLKRYLELIVDSVVRHVSMVLEHNRHERCRFTPKFKDIVHNYPPKIVLPVEDWQEALKPLLDLQDKLLKTSKPQSCRITQVMRNLLLHLVILQGKSRPFTVAQALLESKMNDAAAEWSPALVTETQKNLPEKDLDSCLSALLSCLQKMDSVIVVDRAIIDCMFSLLAFDYAETGARVRTISDAQMLIDLIDLLTNNETFVSQCGQDAASKAARLASEIFARVPHLPQSLFVDKPRFYIKVPKYKSLELECQSAFISRILDHNYIVPVLGIHDGSDVLGLASSYEAGQSKPIDLWLRVRPSRDLDAKIGVILEVARTIRYIHSMDVVLHSGWIRSKNFFLNSNLRAKFEFTGLFASWVREASIYGYESKALLTRYTYESNISAFADLFCQVCFDGHNNKQSKRLVKHAWQLIERCYAQNSSQPSMEDVVTEMETWNLSLTHLDYGWLE